MDQISRAVKKNLLDLDHGEYLQYYNTSVIIIFAYAVAVVVGFLTKQVDYSDGNQLAVIIFVSITFLSVVGILMFNFRRHMKGIREEIRKLS